MFGIVYVRAMEMTQKNYKKNLFTQIMTKMVTA